MNVRAAVLSGAGLIVALMAPATTCGQHPGVVAGETQLAQAVLVTYWAQARGAPPHELWLLVLWRGRAGWLSGPMSGTSAPFDDTRPDLRAARRHLLELGYEVGNVKLTMSFDPQARTVQVLDEKFALEHNLEFIR